MKQEELLNKYPLITYILQTHELLYITYDIGLIPPFKQGAVINFEFNSIKEADEFLDKNLEKIRIEYLMETLEYMHKKIDNHRRELYYLNKRMKHENRI